MNIFLFKWVSSLMFTALTVVCIGYINFCSYRLQMLGLQGLEWCHCVVLLAIISSRSRFPHPYYMKVRYWKSLSSLLLIINIFILIFHGFINLILKQFFILLGWNIVKTIIFLYLAINCNLFLCKIHFENNQFSDYNGAHRPSHITI